MERNSQSPEMMAVYRAYASGLAPTPRPEYRILHGWHPWIQVPSGYLPIRIAQFSRGTRQTGDDRLYHWAIFIPTSTRRGIGNYYEIGGSLREGYYLQHVVHDRHVMWHNERGTHLVGFVAPEHLRLLEARFALVPIAQGRPTWNCQTWVVDALQGLNSREMYAVQMNFAQWYQQMEIVDAAWNVGDV